jgi:plasmid stability protein
MATLTIRNLPDRIRDRLRVRAAKRGVSMEAEARNILAQAADTTGDRKPTLSVAELQQWIAANRKRQHAEKNDSTALIRDRRRETILEVIRAGDDPARVFGDNYRRVLSEADWTEDHVKGLMRQP